MNQDSARRIVRGGAQGGAGLGLATLVHELAGLDLSAVAFGGLVWLCSLGAGALHNLLEDRGLIRETR